MKLHFSHAHFPVTSLGYGKRVGIWFQGCSIHCKGCVARNTWEVETQHLVALESLVARLSPWLRLCDGVTISGGEPFDQPEALLSLIRAIRPMFDGDILVYSGRSKEYLVDSFREILGEIDMLISDPFVETLSDEHALAGSSNQRISLFTPLAKARYSRIDGFRRGMDVAVLGDRVMMAGIPRRGDMMEVTSRAKAQLPV